MPVEFATVGAAECSAGFSGIVAMKVCTVPELTAAGKAVILEPANDWPEGLRGIVRGRA